MTVSGSCHNNCPYSQCSHLNIVIAQEDSLAAFRFFSTLPGVVRRRVGWAVGYNRRVRLGMAMDGNVGHRC